MSQQITTSFIKSYGAGIRMLQQQRGSRLRGAVMFDGNVEGDRKFYDQIDAVEMTEITNRHGDTEYTDTPHRRRMITLSPSEVADLIDRADERRLLNNPMNDYTRNHAAAANRKVDDKIIAAFDADASTGVDGTTTVSFDSAFNFTATAQTFDVDDLLTTRQLLEAAENEEDDMEHSWHFCMDSLTRRDLLGTTPVQSADFNTIRALVNGQIDTFVGFNFHKSQRLPTTSGGVVTLPAWVRKSIQLGVSQEGRAFIDVLPQKRHSIQVRYEIDCGATRMDEKGVVTITYDAVA